MRPLFTALLVALLFCPCLALAQDSDGDGMLDSYELLHSCLQPTVPDADADPDTDGLLSGLEYTLATLPCDPDTDSDGQSDGLEVRFGSNPLLAIISPSGMALTQAREVSADAGWTGYGGQLVWTGSEFYFGNQNLIRRFDADGNPLPGSAAGKADMVWTGTELAVFGPGFTLRYLSSELWENSSFPLTYPMPYKTVWTGSEFGGITTLDGPGTSSPAFVRISASGQSLGLSYLGGNGNLMGLGWTGTEFVTFTTYVPWGFPGIEDPPLPMYMDRIAPDGGVIASTTVDPGYAAWTGSEFLFNSYPGWRTLVPPDQFGPYHPVEVAAPTIAAPELSEYIGFSTSHFVNYDLSGNVTGVVQAPLTADFHAAWTGEHLGIFFIDPGDHTRLKFFALTLGDRDGDGLGKDAETLAGTSASDWDTDQDGLSDGWEVVTAAGCGLDPLVADSATADPDLDGLDNRQEFLAGTSPCDEDSDADLYSDGADCGPRDPNNWASCASCADADADGGFADCDAYTTIDGPDCDDENPNSWNTCATCADNDGDGSWTGCNLYISVSGPDCADTDIDNWTRCATCVDTDLDGHFGGCNAYTTRPGPDCDNQNPRAWTTCATCKDTDADGWYGTCNDYTGISGPDCNDTNRNKWDTCATCMDSDADGWFAGCNQYVTVNGPDCNDSDAYSWNDCGICVDFDGDLRGDSCNRGADCDDSLPQAWNTCATCQDGDGDGYYGVCNNYAGIAGPDCLDTDPDNWWACAYCRDQDGDGRFYNCDAFVLRLGPDCNDANANTWDTCGTCSDSDGDGWWLGCNVFAVGHGPDCDPINYQHWDDCAVCIDLDLDFYGENCNRGADCDDFLPQAWTRCATCRDADGDGCFGACDDNTGLACSGDCSDENPNAWTLCGTCVDNDMDGWYGSCNTYAGILGPDCSDTNRDSWDTCASCVDGDLDGFFLFCNTYLDHPGPDCNDTHYWASTACESCIDADADGWYGHCDRYAGDFLSTIGGESSTLNYILTTTHKQVRTQIIYLASEVGEPGLIRSLSLLVNSGPGTMNNFTVRLRPTDLTQYSIGAVFEGPDAGWTTVYQGNETSGWVSGWHTINFTTPYAYDAASNLMVDISFANTYYHTYAGTIKGSGLPVSGMRFVYATNDGAYALSPLEWSGSSNPTPSRVSFFPKMRFGIERSINGPDCEDAITAVHPAAPEVCDAQDNQCPGDLGYGAIDEGCSGNDADADGIDDPTEALIGTLPGNPDTDGDGISDGAEYNTFGTDPKGWDSDGDGLPDFFEVGNLSGHDAGQNLDPLSAADGALDFDGDGIINRDEYYNGRGGTWSFDPAGFAACGYWGEGDGDGLIGPGDLTTLSAAIRGSVAGTSVYPGMEVQDLDADGVLGPGDQSVLRSMLKSLPLGAIGSLPTGLARVTPGPGGTLSAPVGDTVRVTVAVSNQAALAAPGIPVIFSIDPASTGTATLLGGEGSDAAGSRYDLTSAVADGGRASIVVRLDSAGTVVINARVAECGAGGLGRYSAELVLSEPIVINP